MKTFNEEQLRKNFEGDEDILIDMIEQYDLHGALMLLRVEKAFSTHQLQELKIAAHTLKGALSNFYATKPCELALEIEKEAMMALENGNFNQENVARDIRLLKEIMIDFNQEVELLKKDLQQNFR